jgi:hypothetical protein
MGTNRKITFSLAALSAAAAMATPAAIGAPSGPPAGQTTHSRIGAPVERVVVHGAAGQVRVAAGGRADVRVTRTTSWWSWWPATPEVRQYVRSGVLHLESRCSAPCGIDYRVRVPAGVAVEVRQRAAEVRVTGAPGDVSVKVGAGGVRLELARAPQRIEVDSNVGDVYVAVPRGTYAVTASTRVGDRTVRGLARDHDARNAIRASAAVGAVTVEGP